MVFIGSFVFIKNGNEIMKVASYSVAVLLSTSVLLSACGENDGAVSAVESSQSQTAAVQQHVDHTQHSRMGSHGMAVIGLENLLVYHMALYGQPHDRQILTPAVFANHDDKARFQEWRQSYDGMVTILPENFDLDRLELAAKNPITEFKADIYKGHFERGGERVFENIEFKLSTPVLHLPVSENASPEISYTLVKHLSDAYLVRDIGPRPGKDYIVQILEDANVEAGARFKFNEEAGEFISAENVVIPVEKAQTAYLETSDFQ